MRNTLGLDYSILVIEDSVPIIELLQNIIEEHYRFSVALNGPSAFEIIKKSKPDLILLDIVMPEMDGFEVCHQIKNTPDLRNIPVIFLTGQKSLEDEAQGFAAGASDFVTKPFSPKTLLARIQTHLRLSDQRKLLEHQVSVRTAEVTNLNLEIMETQKEIIHTMGPICEGRSKETGNHVKRVAEYSKLLGESYGLSETDIQLIYAASPMHDIGKVAISDEILQKPGKLTPSERKYMESHSLLGFEMLSGSSRKLLNAARITALEHHEKWDGSGYPKKLKGEEIHLFGRITAVADVFDALSHDRCYKKAWADQDIFCLFKEERGKHFDPKLVDLFFENLEGFLKIRSNNQD
ncbi:MAG: response regulator [SAR324 cluster bacterium]|nr:response regulator [SAR324 cluster bacterium]